LYDPLAVAIGSSGRVGVASLQSTREKPITDERMALAALLEKESDSDQLREMIGCVAQQLMQLDVEGPVGVGHGDRCRRGRARNATGLAAGDTRQCRAAMSRRLMEE
jgi:hypothetical protein